MQTRRLEKSLSGVFLSQCSCVCVRVLFTIGLYIQRAYCIRTHTHSRDVAGPVLFFNYLACLFVEDPAVSNSVSCTRKFKFLAGIYKI